MNDMRMEGGQTKSFTKVLECVNDLKAVLKLIKQTNETAGISPENTLPDEVSL